MSKSKTRLQHTYATEAPFECLTGDLSDGGFLLVVDKRTHELLVREGAEEQTVTVIVNPKGVEVQGVSPRPGTRTLDLDASASDPLKQAGESVEQLRGGARGAPRTGGADERVRTGGMRVSPIVFPPIAEWEEVEEDPESSRDVEES